MNEPARADAHSADILLVEDTVAMARVYQEYLRRGAYDVRWVETGVEAIAELERKAPDAMLLDLRLPDIDGIEVLRHLRARGLDSAVIVVTADGSLATAAQAMREGAQDFLIKPFNADRLLVTLKNVLEHRRLNVMVENLGERPAPAPRPPSGKTAFADALAAIRPLAEVERNAIENAIALCRGNIVKAAALLEINPSTIYRKRAEWNDGRGAQSRDD
jgi:DNA-binding NtrC family response regulator